MDRKDLIDRSLRSRIEPAWAIPSSRFLGAPYQGEIPADTFTITADYVLRLSLLQSRGHRDRPFSKAHPSICQHDVAVDTAHFMSRDESRSGGYRKRD
jgi:hypothetical protein